MTGRGLPRYFGIRHGVLVGAMVLTAFVLVARAVDLHLVRESFLTGQAVARQVRTEPINAHRGVIYDRNGEPLAVSAPVDSVWVNPREFVAARDRWGELTAVLQLSPGAIEGLVTRRMNREFVYLLRGVEPELAGRVQKLAIAGVYLKREYRRYYPNGEVAGHIVGFTDIDDVGQEGIELAFDRDLRGSPGSRRVIKDRLGRWVEALAGMRPPQAGQDLRLALDKRLQYVAYRELKAALLKHHASSASAVVLNARSGELLAAVNQPSFNPNDMTSRDARRIRNRVFTDVFEPGSTIKPFVVATALAANQVTAESTFDTSPGWFFYGRHQVRDVRNFGLLTVAQVLHKSSNVGASRIALLMKPRQLWAVYDALGFGQDTGSGFPGESSGVLTPSKTWRRVGRVTHAYGYGFSVTPLQLARAYSALANHGNLVPVRLLADQPVTDVKTRIFPREVADSVAGMLVGVTEGTGTGKAAAVGGYSVAGKTGTTRIANVGGYEERRYVAAFVGFLPAEDPELIMVVTVTEPHSGVYYGGQVAAPVFGGFMTDAVRLLGISPQPTTTVADLVLGAPKT